MRKKFTQKWLKKGEYYDFKGILLPDVSQNAKMVDMLYGCFEDTLFSYIFFDDRYDKSIALKLDACLNEGLYGYQDTNFDVTVKAGDVVFDVGAWIGDFSAYASKKKAISYAFEPCVGNFKILEETSILNSNIIPVKFGLGDKEEDVYMSIGEGGSSNSFKNKVSEVKELVSITTIDQFVEKNNLDHVDFIKADIEGAERDMLRGATRTLKDFAPKLAICTYHLPDDKEVLEKIILEANPNYKIVHLRHKLFATIKNK